MNIRELLKETRSCRRFDQARPVEISTLIDSLENQRYTPSPANLQPLRFGIILRPSLKEELFPLLKWAGYIEDWTGPAEGERPGAYILIMGDPSRSQYISWDYGIALLSIMLSLREKGIASCPVAACDRDAIRQMLDIEPGVEIAAVLAVGWPLERVVVETAEGDDIRYYRDEQGVHHVPKRSLNALIYKIWQ